ncbi:hypothetical protein [Cognatiluteimonas telluris]|jgi:hypothetical protein|nr:hypothetical protein [Lysobacter telluris]
MVQVAEKNPFVSLVKANVPVGAASIAKTAAGEKRVEAAGR